MTVYIIRPKATSVTRSLTLTSRTFSAESRTAQVEEVVDFWQQDPVYREIEHWLQDAENTLKYPLYSGITGASIVEMPDEEAVQLQRDLPGVSVLRDQPIELIQPHRNSDNPRDEVNAADLWHLDAIALKEARQNGFSGTGKNITVAVFDTGIDDSHSELQGKVVESYSLNNRTQQIQLLPSQDTDGHGTHVAGLICGEQVGVAPETKLINCVVIPQKTGSLAGLVLWLDWVATRQDVSIVNMSLGFPKYVDYISDWIDTLLAVGILPVCAIGNEGINKTRTPGNCRSALSVGAGNSDGRVAAFSGSGMISVDNHLYNVPYLIAPGEQVYSSVQGGGYEAWDGTSMATPIVSGVAALILEKYDKQITVGSLFDALLSSCQDLGQYKERQGRGLVQVTPAL
ncbi:S8 family serine peptidase [Aetokthonos hydrillicola Thurmond2011]|jgi:subtilisin family serine protease|uniref:S8 family serine peptidase n=1 Tax=Aetokthonos hydrillicola Thurmond2011 TaxID=2712845 RepID=A0AAP5IEW3_9CYAN|nr:S8 family serine peptidase [Aetokthonos hydrillicola]MBO3463064.1 S8 family serine peptidase [Aetokthonos hydrillicola CCALA 1050]MBW4591112.1 S8 family serine peptidase [Aetokthonos hydrillicola CCALA 1050]MDR9900340.1 S8 family serine peptidase [Aetokthonos hydrillicola Thurmond2011]